MPVKVAVACTTDPVVISAAPHFRYPERGSDIDENQSMDAIPILGFPGTRSKISPGVTDP
jgi:hypothetical protein